MSERHVHNGQWCAPCVKHGRGDGRDGALVGSFLPLDQIQRLRAIEHWARRVLACGVGNLSAEKYRRRVEAFDALDDALDGHLPADEGWQQP